MKKIIILTAVLALLFGSCRKESDYVPYIGESHKLAYNTYEEQFTFLWKSISTGYVFWDVDTTDWDAVYSRYLPQFQALDQRYAKGDSVRNDDLYNLYHGIPHPADSDNIVTIRPGREEVGQRDYFIEYNSSERPAILAFLNDIESNGYTVLAHESGSFVFHEEAISSMVTYHYILFQLSDGRRVPYLWQSMAAFTPIIRSLGDGTMAGDGAQLLDHWLRAITDTPRDQLAGIILDNRCNNGGFQDDLDYLIGSFIKQPVEVMQTRYKEGPGRFEYSQWVPYHVRPNKKYFRDITAERIPYVILCDINSISMGEIEPMCAKAALPTAYTIGERTYGANCPLQPYTDINLNYGGPFGDGASLRGHYIYTSTFEALIGGRVTEGIGHTPDKIVLRKDHNGSFAPQLDAALNYIANY